MINFFEKTIGEIVAKDYRSAAVFKSYNIDYWCKGNRTLMEVCEKQSLSRALLNAELEKAMQKPNPKYPKFDFWSLDLLADYIEKKHHRYVKGKTPEIQAYLKKICQVHGNAHPELMEVRQLFESSAHELVWSMHKEEAILFPYIRIIAKAELEEKKNIGRPPFGTVGNLIEMMMHEHDSEGEQFRKIAYLTNDYTPPESACKTYSETFALLKEFEEDLHLHIHLENNILFPKSIELEKIIYHA